MDVALPFALRCSASEGRSRPWPGEPGQPPATKKIPDRPLHTGIRPRFWRGEVSGPGCRSVVNHCAMSDEEEKELEGNDDEVVDDEFDEYFSKLYPPEERPFSRAWRRAIDSRYYYSSYFDHNSTISGSFRGWTPQVAVIKKELEGMSASDAIFLAAMVSFYNPDTGGRLLRGLGAQGLGDIAASLDEERRQRLAELLVTYIGW